MARLIATEAGYHEGDFVPAGGIYEGDPTEIEPVETSPTKSRAARKAKARTDDEADTGDADGLTSP
jgi:hypothetical protein